MAVRAEGERGGARPESPRVARRAGRARVALARTLAIAATTLCAIAAASFALQAVALGRPSGAELVAVKALATMSRYGSSQATLTIDGRRIAASCTQHFNGDGHVETATLSDGQTLEKIGDRLIQPGRLAADEFALAGCPRSVTGWLRNQLKAGARIVLARTHVDGHAVYALRAPTARIPLAVYIERGSALPVELSISGRGVEGSSDVAFRSRSAQQDRARLLRESSDERR